MIVIVDSNQFFSDLLMTGREFGIILGQHSRGQFELVLPEVVVREIPKLFRERYSATLNKYSTSVQMLGRLGHSVTAVSLPDPNRATDAVTKQLRQRLAVARVDVPGIPDVPLSDLVDDSIAELRPWQAKSRGFRDALIWRTVIDQAERNQVVLISNNHGDFAASDKKRDELHPHLQQQVNALGHGTDRVKLQPSLEAFISEFVPPADQALLAAQGRLAEDQAFEVALYGDIEQALYRFDFNLARGVTIIGSDAAAIDQLSVDDVSISEVKITSAYEGDSDRSAFIEIVAHAIMYFGFVTDIGGAEWLIEDRADIEIESWESSFAQGRTHARYVEIIYWADFDLDSGELGELEQAGAHDDTPKG